MRRFLAGGAIALLLAAIGLWVWQGLAANKSPIPGAPPPSAKALELPQPGADAPRFGPAPPNPPAASKANKEEARFNRYDRNRDDLISRIEMMSTRTAAFKKLDKDGNNLLTFEEWAAATGERFAKADANSDKLLTRSEFATTAPKPVAKPKCKC